jgi:hypothetical protein
VPVNAIIRHVVGTHSHPIHYKRCCFFITVLPITIRQIINGHEQHVVQLLICFIHIFYTRNGKHAQLIWNPPTALRLFIFVGSMLHYLFIYLARMFVYFTATVLCRTAKIPKIAGWVTFVYVHTLF